jgi:hypothetical protein
MHQVFILSFNNKKELDDNKHIHIFCFSFYFYTYLLTFLDTICVDTYLGAVVGE